MESTDCSPLVDRVLALFFQPIIYRDFPARVPRNFPLVYGFRVAGVLFEPKPASVWLLSWRINWIDLQILPVLSGRSNHAATSLSLTLPRRFPVPGRCPLHGLRRMPGAGAAG